LEEWVKGESMKDAYIHPSDQELLSFLDGELSSRLSLRIRRHLEECWDCRSRRKALEQAIDDFVQIHHESLDCLVPPADGPRALLRARMSEDVANPNLAWLHFWPRQLGTRYAAYVAISLAVFAVCWTAGYRLKSTPSLDRQVLRIAYLIPDSRFTPGFVRSISVNEVCTTTYSDDTDPVPLSIRQQVFHEYGVEPQHSADYALDYLVSPQLGGTADIRNLWPEPEAQTVWNMRAKDALEDHLQELVCQGRIDLGTAQRDLATNWISAYQKYFHTSKPIDPPLAQLTARDQ
jgi:hypothetical protein